MLKEIQIGGEAVRFKASAATRIFYNHLFKKDVGDELTDYIRQNNELKELQKQILNVTALPDEDASKAGRLTELLTDPRFSEFKRFSERFFPQFAYITYLEANTEQPKDIYKALTMEDFTAFLCMHEMADFTGNAGAFLDLWQSQAKQTVNPKNALGR